MIKDNIKDPSSLDPIVRQRLIAAITRDIKNIGCIYRSVGAALYDEPMDRLVHRIIATVVREFPVLLSKTDQLLTDEDEMRIDEEILAEKELEIINHAKHDPEDDVYTRRFAASHYDNWWSKYL